MSKKSKAYPQSLIVDLKTKLSLVQSTTKQAVQRYLDAQQRIHCLEKRVNALEKQLLKRITFNGNVPLDALETLKRKHDDRKIETISK